MKRINYKYSIFNCVGVLIENSVINKYNALIAGTPYEAKVSCTVWSGGKVGDNFKDLPITIMYRYVRE